MAGEVTDTEGGSASCSPAGGFGCDTMLVPPVVATPELGDPVALGRVVFAE